MSSRNSESMKLRWADPAYRAMMLTAQQNSKAYMDKAPGINRAARALSDDQVREVRRLFATGMNRRKIALKLGVKYGPVCGVISGVSYKDVT